MKTRGAVFKKVQSYHTGKTRGEREARASAGGAVTWPLRAKDLDDLVLEFLFYKFFGQGGVTVQPTYKNDP